MSYVLFYRDPTKASAFIIPFDAGVHSYIDHITGRPRLASPHGWRAQQLLRDAAKNEVSWLNLVYLCHFSLIICLLFYF
ncbi:hypothetical protein EON65_00530 [archaeon]|nr:MAG: hypothetical protein EON65_00530 [archaeon]